MGANSDRDAEGPLRTPLTGAFRSHTSLEAQSEKLPRQDRFGPALSPAKQGHFPGCPGTFGLPENPGTLDRPDTDGCQLGVRTVVPPFPAPLATGPRNSPS